VAHQLIFYTDDVNIMGRSVHTTRIKKNTEALVFVGMETGLEVNCEKSNCVVMSRNQNVGRSHSTKTDNVPFQRMEGLRYLGTTLTHQTSIQEEIRAD
jgi:hypothetical protein